MAAEGGEEGAIASPARKNLHFLLDLPERDSCRTPRIFLTTFSGKEKEIKLCQYI